MIKWASRTFLLGLGVIIAILAWLLLSTSGLQTLFNQIASRVEGLEVKDVKGRLIGPMRFSGVSYTAADGGRVELQTLDLDWRPKQIWSGKVKIESLSANGLTVVPGPKPAQGPKKTGIELTDIKLPINLQIESFELTQIRIANASIRSVTGSASFVNDSLSLRELHIDAPQGSAELSAELRTQGKYPLHAEADIRLESSTAKKIHVLATASGDVEQLDIESSIANSVRLTGQLRDLTSAPGWSANILVDGLSPKQWDPSLPPGSLNGTLEAQGDLQHAQVTGMLSAVGTELGDMEFHLNATGDERSIQLDRLDLVHRDIPGKMQATGKINFVGALEYRFDASWRELRWLGAQGNGDLKLQGSADRLTAELRAGFNNTAGEPGLTTAPIFAHLEISNIQSKQPRIMLDAKAEQLAYANYKLAGLTAKADVDLADKGPSNLEIRSARFEIGEQTLKDLSITGSGTMHKHQVNARFSHGLADLELGLIGAIQEQNWNGTLQQLQLTGETLGQWALLQPAALQLNKQNIALEQACLKSGSAEDRVCIDGAWDERSGWRLAVNSEKLDPAPFLSLWRSGIKWDGAISIAAQLQGGAEPLSGNMNLRSACCGFTLNHTGEQTSVQYRDLSLNAKLSGGNFDSALKVQLPDQGALSANVKMQGAPEQPWQQRQLHATAQLQLNSLRLLQGLSPHFSVQQGSGNMDLALSGTVADPKLAGKLSVQDLVVDVPIVGVTLHDFNVSIQADSPQQLHLASTARVDQGVLRGDGLVHFKEDSAYEGKLRITGERVESIDLPQARVLTSPDINIELAKNSIKIDGSINIDEADIDLEKARGSDVVTSDDVVIVTDDKGGQTATAASKVHTSVLTRLGEATRFKGYGLTAKLGGELEVTHESGKPTTARGEIQIVDGKYVIYGQTLDVESGRLVFAGGRIDDPGLDLRVVRKAADVEVGARVRGTAETPRLTLFSQPQMPDTEILSYLILGHPPGSGRGSQDAALLFAAAQSLLPNQSGDITGKLKSQFGLEQLSLESADNGNGRALVIGKYLSPKLFISYAAGLADAANVFRTRYQLTKNWLLETESSVEKSGGGILYKIER